MKKKKIFHTFLGPETRFEGSLNFDGIARLEGQFTGKIESRSGSVIVGESAVIEGEIAADTVVISGKVRGKVSALTRVEIHVPGQVLGDIRSPMVVIDDGGVFFGKCIMKTDEISEEVSSGKTINLIERHIQQGLKEKKEKNL